MKHFLYPLFVVLGLILSCSNAKSSIFDAKTNLSTINDTLNSVKNKKIATNDTIRIANDSLQYEVIIIDPGFNAWLISRSFPRGYHSESFLKNKNIFYITEWNNRVLQPQRYNANLYEMTIDYERNIDYGYEVNYLIYNYMIYFQNTFKQNLFGYVPPR